jgi:hypothetical protein
MVVASAAAMLAFLLAIAALGFGRLDGLAFYLVASVIAVALVRSLWRRERLERRAEEALLPPERRPARRVPRRPISFRLAESVLAFAFWYAAAVAIDRVVTGTTTAFTLAAVAPFAAFMLATITIAGRHMAFRLTAEEESERAE